MEEETIKIKKLKIGKVKQNSIFFFQKPKERSGKCVRRAHFSVCV
jgi:hypothetical protein